MPARPARKKVRCPKCTALFSEPSKATFECPICSCRLSGNGAVAIADNLPTQANQAEFERTEVSNNNEDASKAQNQEKRPIDGIINSQKICGVNGSPLSTQIFKEEEQLVEQIKAPCLPLVFSEHKKEGKPLAEGGLDNADYSKDVTRMENTLQENNLVLVKTEERDGEEPLGQSGESNKHLQSQMFQATRCEFSFKYSLEGALHLDSDSYKKRLPSRLLEVEKSPDMDASDVAFHCPLRVRIVNSREESSDQSEHGRYSFSSDMDSRDGSESEFDFPAPWAEGMQGSTPIESLGRDEHPQYKANEALLATPHQLELLDDHDLIASELYSLEESRNPFEGSENAPQVANDAKAMSCKEMEHVTVSSSLASPSQVIDAVNLLRSVALDDKSFTNHGSTQGLNLLGQHEEATSCARNNDEILEFSTKVDREVSLTALELQQVAQGCKTDECMNVEFAKILEVSETQQASGGNIVPACSLVAISTNMQDESYEGNGKTLDHHRRQESEVGLDLYSHHEVDEWHNAKEEPTLSRPNYAGILAHNDACHMDSSSFFSDYALESAPNAHNQPYSLSNHHVADYLSYGESSSSHMYAYQSSSQAMVLPGVLPGHIASPFGYNSVSSVCTCMMCTHQHHPLMRTHLPPHCALCLNHPGSVVCNGAHSDHLGYCHPAHHHPAPALASSLPHPSNLGQRYDLPCANIGLQASLSSKVSQYPPLPKDGASPYFSCKGCNTVLKVPVNLPPRNGPLQKLRCGVCGRVTKFSVKQTAKRRQINSLHGATYTRSQDEYNIHSLASSHGHNFAKPISLWTQAENSGQLLSQVEEDLYFSRPSDLCLQEGDSPRGNDFVTSVSTDPRYLEDGVGANGVMTAREKAPESSNALGFGRVQHASSLAHVYVDERDEGLDFGAPRISDGDSLDQSESRMRSPEDMQGQRTCGGIPEGAPVGGYENDWNEEQITVMQGKKPGSPLLVLLNQESTRFMLNLDPGAPYDESVSASLSPASADSPLVDNAKNHERKRRNSTQSRASAVSRGPKYIAGLLRRSLRDKSKGGQ